MPILEIFENMTHVYTSFALDKGSLLYQEADSATHNFQWHVPG